MLSLTGDNDARSAGNLKLNTDKEGATITVQLPGVAEKDIDLSLEGNAVTISAKRQLDVPEGAKVLRQERHNITFKQQVRLPFQADSERGEAHYQDGVLTVKVFRQAADQPRRIAVTSQPA